jgi:hypothetical protein
VSSDDKILRWQLKSEKKGEVLPPGQCRLIARGKDKLHVGPVAEWPGHW